MIPTQPTHQETYGSDLALTGRKLTPLFDPVVPFCIEAWEMRRKEIQTCILSILGNFPPKPHILALEERSRKQLGSVILHEFNITWDNEESHLVTVLVPNEREPKSFPCLVAPHPTSLHGMCSGWDRSLEPNDFHYPIEAAEAGFVVLTFDHFTLPLRTAPGREYDSSSFYHKHPKWSALGKAAWDLQRVVDVAERLPFCDSDRLGAIGFSLGAHTSLFASAFDERIRATVVASGVSSLAGDCRADYVWVRRTGKYSYMPSLAPFFDRGEAPPFDFHEVAALVAPRSLLLLSGFRDAWCGGGAIMGEFVTHVQNAYAGMGAEEQFSAAFHGYGHAFPSCWRNFAYSWLRERLSGTHIKPSIQSHFSLSPSKPPRS